MSPWGVRRAGRFPMGSFGESNDPEPDARHALDDEADPADALPAFEHGIVTNADRTQLQHILVPVLKTTTPRPIS